MHIHCVANVRRRRAKNDFFLIPHEEVLGSNTGEGKQLVFFKMYILIDYYIHCNKSECDATEIHDVAIKV